ncbi:hypothetical protein MXM31_12000 [Klebsiella aerogenes]|uniref:hypothetical protein n=1 Tax=Klebsiella aerogenes TaxID=548 RepID=UPI002D807E6E|nr:hypothetical protein [Klebsiella aerogenes]MEB5696888.1 hypothetical protein [Klebsiella aerogenes]
MANFVAYDECLQVGFARDGLLLIEAVDREGTMNVIVERMDSKRFCLTFKKVLFSSRSELDSFERTAGEGHLFDWNEVSANFGELFDSRLMTLFSPRSDVSPASCRHFFLATYDDVFNIIAESVTVGPVSAAPPGNTL